MVIGPIFISLQNIKICEFSKFSIRLETKLDKLHLISRTQIKKHNFLWLKFTSRVNGKK